MDAAKEPQHIPHRENEENPDATPGCTFRWTFWLCVAVMFAGFAVVWAGMLLVAGGDHGTAGIVLRLCGAAVAVLGAIAMCFVLRGDEGSICSKVIIGFGVVGGILLVVYLVILYSSEYDDGSLREDQGALKLWSEAAKAWWYIAMTASGIVVLAVMGCVGACLLGRIGCLRKPTFTETEPTSVAIQIEEPPIEAV